MYTQASLWADLQQMGLERTDTVLMHFSMRQIGEVGGGADTVLGTLMQYFAPGLLVIPTHSWRNVNAEQPIFDPAHTPVCIGLLPEKFRHKPGVVRSWHPTHSVAAYGADAVNYCAGDEVCQTPCHRQSTWGKLIDRRAKILMVGVNLKRCTFLHGVEEYAEVPNRVSEEVIPYVLRMADGSLLPIPCRRHVGYPSEQFDRAEPLLREGGALTDGRFGGAHVLVLDAVQTAHIVEKELRRNPEWFAAPGEGLNS